MDGDSGEGIDLLSFAVRLRRMTGELNRIAHDFAHEHGLHTTDVQALIKIFDAPSPITPSRLREELNLTSGAVTACLDRLERAGHIRRVRDVHDRRVVHLHYLDTAKEFAAAFFRPLGQSTDNALRRFTPDQLRTVAAFLDTMNDELDALRASSRSS
ncbi:MarR family transcriptional regulator [Sphaerisporangium siamense]|uniref:DNA-binding MarR family transcriptional regulator n=1 Tax=Sphaerisporangium siamense TaxID=795645 RepID=A0A7W7D5E6_9ACTN|nr:MarR family winged helix-turn-helix transcriptional regulator [Sphaerisporangium siamense]MBB4700309.1 DNA-binding MarR family transcriptional regulator [Sphaerisporangium siamense]GII87724.1 MarR family transcriptional regulator [Sphaerisporangium siamense]